MNPSRWRLDPRVAQVLDDAPGERLLAWGELSDGRVVVCTTWALHSEATGRVAWEDVVQASWADDALEVTLGPAAARRTVTLDFAQPAQVPAVVRERVEWTVLATQHVDLTLPDGRRAGARMSARRSPRSGDVAWSVVFDAGVDARDPAWRGAADLAVAELQASLGL